MHRADSCALNSVPHADALQLWDALGDGEPRTDACLRRVLCALAASVASFSDKRSLTWGGR